jgi:uncharacterized protein YxeA
MKKVIIFLILVLIVIASIFFGWYNNNVQALNEINKFNLEYENKTEGNITGVDLTTLLNKSIDNNERYSVERNSDGTFEDDGKYSIKIYVQLVADESYFPMEALEQSEKGINGFTSAYGAAIFKCQKKEYHTNGRISELYFEIQN